MPALSSLLLSASVSLGAAAQFPPPAGSLDVTAESYDLGGFLCGKQEPTVKIWYPTDLSNGPYPIATFGHGMGGVIIDDLTSSLASLGFVVVAPGTSGGKCDDDHWKDLLHALEGSKADPSLHTALNHVDWTKVGIYGHSMGGFASLNGAADVLQNPDKYSFQLKAMLDSHGYIGEYSAAAAKITIPAMFTTGDEDHQGQLKGAFEAAPTNQKVLAHVAGAQHMEPAETGRLNPFDAHFLGCHVADIQASCEKIYGSGSDSLCKANEMTECEVVSPGIVLA